MPSATEARTRIRRSSERAFDIPAGLRSGQQLESDPSPPVNPTRFTQLGRCSSRSRPGDHLTTRQYGRLLDDWVALIGLDPAAYGIHSLRRTKVALVYKRTGNLRACQLLLGHTKLESTVRYLGIEVDDALVLSEQTDL